MVNRLMTLICLSFNFNCSIYDFLEWKLELERFNCKFTQVLWENTFTEEHEIMLDIKLKDEKWNAAIITPE